MIGLSQFHILSDTHSGCDLSFVDCCVLYPAIARKAHGHSPWPEETSLFALQRMIWSMYLLFPCISLFLNGARMDTGSLLLPILLVSSFWPFPPSSQFLASVYSTVSTQVRRVHLSSHSKPAMPLILKFYIPPCVFEILLFSRFSSTQSLP